MESCGEMKNDPYSWFKLETDGFVGPRILRRNHTCLYGMYSMHVRCAILVRNGTYALYVQYAFAASKNVSK